MITFIIYVGYDINVETIIDTFNNLELANIINIGCLSSNIEEQEEPENEGHSYIPWLITCILYDTEYAYNFIYNLRRNIEVNIDENNYNWSVKNYYNYTNYTNYNNYFNND